MASFDRQYQRARMGGPAGQSASASSSMMMSGGHGGYGGMGSPVARDRGGTGFAQHQQQQQQHQQQRYDAFGSPQHQQQHQQGGDGSAMSPHSQQQHAGADQGKRPTNFLLKPKHQQMQQHQQQQAQHHHHLSTPARGGFGAEVANSNGGGGGSLFSPHPPVMGQESQQAPQPHPYQHQHPASSTSASTSQPGTPHRGPAVGALHRPHRPSGLRNEQGVGTAAGSGSAGGAGRGKTAVHVDPPISGLHDTEGGLGITSPSQQPSTTPTATAVPPSRAGTGAEFGGASSMMMSRDGDEADRQLSRVQTHVSATPRTPGSHRHWHDTTATGTAATTSAAEACVTVFGFTPEHAGHVLSEMGRCGTIVRKQHGSGNWIHLQFASRIEAQRALSRCGQVLHNTLMIGVIPCTDDEFTRDAAARSPASPGVLGTPVHKKPPRILGTKKGAPGTPSASTPTTATVSPSRSYVGALGDFLFSW